MTVSCKIERFPASTTFCPFWSATKSKLLLRDLQLAICFVCAGWSDHTLLRCGRFYSASVRSAEDRLRHYGTHFPCKFIHLTIEVRALPSFKDLCIMSTKRSAWEGMNVSLAECACVLKFWMFSFMVNGLPQNCHNWLLRTHPYLFDASSKFRC